MNFMKKIKISIYWIFSLILLHINISYFRRNSGEKVEKIISTRHNALKSAALDDTIAFSWNCTIAGQFSQHTCVVHTQLSNYTEPKTKHTSREPALKSNWKKKVSVCDFFCCTDFNFSVSISYPAAKSGVRWILIARRLINLRFYYCFWCCYHLTVSRGTNPFALIKTLRDLVTPTNIAVACKWFSIMCAPLAKPRLLFSQIVFLCAEERVADCNIRTHVIYTGTAQKHARSGRIHFVARNCCCPAAWCQPSDWNVNFTNQPPPPGCWTRTHIKHNTSST